MTLRPLERLAARAIALAVRALGATWRVRVEGEDRREIPRGARVYATWHETWLVCAFHFRDRGIAMAVSESRDGERAAAMLADLGFGESVRGSSSRGAARALRALATRLRGGGAVGVLVDGPRGPARLAKPGAARAASLGRAPVAIVGCAARPCLRIPSWDRTLVPLPFARVQLAVLEQDDASDAGLTGALEQAREQAERELSSR